MITTDQYWNAVVRGMISNSTEGPDTAGNIAALNIIYNIH